MGFQNKVWFFRDKKPTHITEISNKISSYNKRITELEKEIFPFQIVDGVQVQSNVSILSDLKVKTSNLQLSVDNMPTVSNQSKVDLLVENAENVNNTINLMNNDIKQLLEIVNYMILNSSESWDSYAGSLKFDNEPSVQYELNPVLSVDNKNTNFQVPFTKASLSYKKD